MSADAAPDLAVLDELSGEGPANHAAVIEPGSAFVGVVGADGRVGWSEAGFADLVGDPRQCAGLRKLVEGAAASGVRTGVVTTSERGAIAMQARCGSSGSRWPLEAEARAALARLPGATLLIAFAPSRSPAWALASSLALGLSPREVELVSVLLETANLEQAANRLGVARETAKDTLSRACRRADARNASELCSKLLELSCGESLVVDGAVGAAAGLTSAEIRVAGSIARGETVATSAKTLGLAEATIKSHRKAIFAKTTTTGERDLRRLLLELSGALRLEAADEVVVDTRAQGERPRVLIRGPRRIAFFDYGPTSGRPLLLMHSHSSWRRAPPPFLARLHRDGWRPIIVQRPGFGLTDPSQDDYLREAADDMAEVLDRLRSGPAAVFAQGASTAVALEFAARHPGRFLQGVIANPKPTQANMPRGGGLIFAMVRTALNHPRLASLVVRQALVGTTTGALNRLKKRVYADLEDDLPADRPEILEHVVRDVQALHARTTRGVVDELGVYARGWSAPSALKVGPWRIAVSALTWSRAEAEAYARLPGFDRREIEGVVVLRAYTDPGPLADLLLR